MPLKTSSVELSWRLASDPSDSGYKMEIKAGTRGKKRIPDLFGPSSAYNPIVWFRDPNITLKVTGPRERLPIVTSRTLFEPALAQEISRRKTSLEPLRYQIKEIQIGQIRQDIARVLLTFPVHQATFIFHDGQPDNPSPDMTVTITRKYQQSL
jgi:hypothetical protein